MKITGIGLVQIPRNVRLHGVQTEGTHFLQPVTPVFRHDPEVMHRSGKDAERFIIKKELVAGKCEFHTRPWETVMESLLDISGSANINTAIDWLHLAIDQLENIEFFII